MGFQRENSELRCDACSLESLARSYGTPLFVYSRDALVRNFSGYRDAFLRADPLICYSVKSNGNISILRALAELGAGADIVSGGELFRAVRAGIDPGKIVYSGVGKRDDEIAMAIEAGIYMFNVESESELQLISDVASGMGARANISLRINPDIDAGAHRYTATARKETKFGIPEAEAPELYRKAANLPGVNPVGVDVHLGSQITDIGPYRRALERLSRMVELVQSAGIDCRVIDIGGGFGITYRDETTLTPADIAALAVPLAEKTGCALVLEPGRSVSGDAGVLITRIIHVKEGGDRIFYICDAGMNDLIRPPLYGAYHNIEPVIIRDPGDLVTADLVGPICETADYLALERPIPRCRQGDLLAVMNAGAYCFSMSSNYNARPRAAEVMVEGASHRLIRSRESCEDLVRGEMIP